MDFSRLMELLTGSDTLGGWVLWWMLLGKSSRMGTYLAYRTPVVFFRLIAPAIYFEIAGDIKL